MAELTRDEAFADDVLKIRDDLLALAAEAYRHATAPDSSYAEQSLWMAKHSAYKLAADRLGGALDALGHSEPHWLRVQNKMIDRMEQEG